MYPRRLSGVTVAILTSLVLILVPVFSAGTHASGANLQNVSLVLDWTLNSDHAGLVVAMRKGFFQQHHVHMFYNVPSDTTAQIKLVAAGKADFGISYESDLLAARAQGIPVQSVMCIMQHPLNTLLTLKRSGITRPRQLVGRKVGMAGSPSDIPMVSTLMAHDGASIKQVRMVNVGYNLLPALLTGKVDAVIGVYWTWEAIQAQMKGYAVNAMRVERWGVPNYCELVVVASDDTVHRRPALVRDTVQALQQGYAYAESHPTYAWQALHGADNTLDQKLVLRSVELLKSAVTDAPTVGYQNPAQWRHYAAWLAANKLISKPVDASKAFTNQFLAPHVR